jgi:hypothetical protein
LHAVALSIMILDRELVKNEKKPIRKDYRSTCAGS